MKNQPDPTTPAATFTPVALRRRHDGWTPDRQLAFIDALAETACVDEAARALAMSRESAYRLRARADARSFRLAWDVALDYAIRRLSDAALSRAIHGVPVPHFYKGEQVGEHRRYNDRLTMFLLRYRDPLRYAATLDRETFAGHPEDAAETLDRLRAAIRQGGAAGQGGVADPADADGDAIAPPPLPGRMVDRDDGGDAERAVRRIEEKLREMHERMEYEDAEDAPSPAAETAAGAPFPP